MGIQNNSISLHNTFFKYPLAPMLGIYATQQFIGIQHELRDYKWTYLLIGSQYLAQRWREVRLNHDIMRLQYYILSAVGKKQRPPRTALRALHATYKRLRKVYALRPDSQRIGMLEQWRTAAVPALSLMYLSDEVDKKYKGPLQSCVQEASKSIDSYRVSNPLPAITLPARLHPELEPIIPKFQKYPETRYAQPQYPEMRYPDTPFPEPKYPEPMHRR